MFKRTLIIISIIFVLASVHLFIYTKIIAASFEIDQLTRDLSKIRSQNRNLNSQISKGESLERIEKISREKLQMIDPDKIKFLKP